MGEMAEEVWETAGGGEHGCRGEVDKYSRGEVQAAAPWTSFRTDHGAGPRCRGESTLSGAWGSCRTEMAVGPRSHAMVESGLEPSDTYGEGVEFSEVSTFPVFPKKVTFCQNKLAGASILPCLILKDYIVCALPGLLHYELAILVQWL